MYARFRNPRPQPWPEHCANLPSRHFAFFYHFNWSLSWVAWALARWPLLDVLDHLGAFSVLIVTIFWFTESGSRVKQRHYQAWQVINTAQGKGGNGGRIEALQELNSDDISLVGVDAGEAFLQGIDLSGAKLARCDFHASDLRNSVFERATMDFCSLHDANFRGSRLSSASLAWVDLLGSDLNGADLSRASLENADLQDADLRNADVSSIKWNASTKLHMANIWNIRHADPAFVQFATRQGAVSLADDSQWEALQSKTDSKQ